MSVRNFLAIALLTVVTTLSGCSSTSIAKLEGSWRLFWINDLTDENIYIWNFEGGNLNILVYQPPTPANPTPTPYVGGTAQYKTSAEFLDAVVEISGFVYSVTDPKVIPQVSNGKWVIEKIDDEVMRISTTDQEGSGGSTVTREFTRE